MHTHLSRNTSTCAVVYMDTDVRRCGSPHGGGWETSNFWSLNIYIYMLDIV